MGLPDKRGRGVLFKKLLSKMSVSEDIKADKLSEMTTGFSGAEVEHVTNEAGLMAIKEAIKDNTQAESVKISQEHFIRSINHIRKSRQASPQTKADRQTTTILSPFKFLSPAIL